MKRVLDHLQKNNAFGLLRLKLHKKYERGFIMIKSVTILNENNEKLFVETYIPERVRSTIFFCHGITGCRKGRTTSDCYFQDLAKRLMDKGFKVVLFDYSGHGDSEGADYDVSLTKSTSELKKVFDQEVVDESNVSFLAFSYGATVLCRFLEQKPGIKPNHIVMYSPALFPLESCFLNENSIFGKDIVNDYQNGVMEKNGYAVVGAKGFRFGKKMIEDCKSFKPDYYKNLSSQIIVMSGNNDVILDTKYNEIFCQENGIENLWFEASHSLFEDIESVFRVTIDYFIK